MSNISEILEDYKFSKANKIDMDNLDVFARKEFKRYSARLDKERDDLLTLEHYTERYVAVQT